MPFDMFAGNGRKLIIDIVADETGDPEDITDATVLWQCARGTTTKFSRTPVITKTMGHGIVVSDASGGVVEVSLTAADTASLPAGTYYHELLVIDVTGDQQNLVADTFTIKRRLVLPS